jgi:hypothetical protein
MTSSKDQQAQWKRRQEEASFAPHPAKPRGFHDSLFGL